MLGVGAALTIPLRRPPSALAAVYNLNSDDQCSPRKTERRLNEESDAKPDDVRWKGVLAIFTFAKTPDARIVWFVSHGVMYLPFRALAIPKP